jgi:hypothetical protein
VDRDAYLLSLCRYVERNPVAARIVAAAADWPWSSYRAHVGPSPTPQWLDSDGLHGYLLERPAATAADRRRAGAVYAKMVAEVSDESLWASGLRQQVFLGDEMFVERTLRRLPAARADGRGTDGVPRRQTRRPASLASMLAAGPERDQAMLRAYRDGAFTMAAIASELGLSVSRVSRVIAAVEAKGGR